MSAATRTPPTGPGLQRRRAPDRAAGSAKPYSRDDDRCAPRRRAAAVSRRKVSGQPARDHRKNVTGVRARGRGVGVRGEPCAFDRLRGPEKWRRQIVRQSDDVDRVERRPPRAQPRFCPGEIDLGSPQRLEFCFERHKRSHAVRHCVARGGCWNRWRIEEENRHECAGSAWTRAPDGRRTTTWCALPEGRTSRMNVTASRACGKYVPL